MKKTNKEPGLSPTGFFRSDPNGTITPDNDRKY